LAGTSYAIAAVADDLDRHGDHVRAAKLNEQSAELRQWVRELRTLIVNMAPPKLHEQGLAAAIGDLTSSLQARGIATDVDIDPSARFDAETEALVFRCAQESVRNVLAHADAGQVSLSVEGRDDAGVRMVVVDDGRGYDPLQAEQRREDGHIGLELLQELVEGSGGSLKVKGVPGVGTTVTLETIA
jgi:signal transduction histidine kinase